MDKIIEFIKGLFSFNIYNEEKQVINDRQIEVVNQDIPPVTDIDVEDSSKPVYEEQEQIYSQIETNFPADKTHWQQNSCVNSKSMQSLADIIIEFDNYYQRLENEDAKVMVKLFQSRIIEALENMGAEVIADDRFFDTLRHTPVPYSIVKDGVEIKSFIRKGLAIQDNIILKAQVRV